MSILTIAFDGMIVSSYDHESRVARCVYGWVGGTLLDPSTLPPLTIEAADIDVAIEILDGVLATVGAEVTA